MPISIAPRQNKDPGYSLARGLGEFYGAGASLLSPQLGQAVKEGFDPSLREQNQPVKQNTAIAPDEGGDAMQRRLQEENNHPVTQLAQANVALNNLPPDVQQEYRPVLQKASAASKYGGTV